MDDVEALAAARSFEAGLRARIAGDVTPLPFGELVITDDLRGVYDLNLAIVAADASPDPAEVLATTARELARRGADHARVAYADGAALDRASEIFKAAGWARTDHVIMRLRNSHRPPWPEQAHLLDARQRDDLRRRLTRARPWCDSEEIVDMFVQFARRIMDRGPARAVGVLDEDGEVIGGAMVYGDGPILQIEEVEVDASAQGKGLGKVLLQAALSLALAHDPQLVFLVADADDWPRHWYERLGFEVIGTTGDFHRS